MEKSDNFFRKVKNKIGKVVLKSFPLNVARIFGLKLCGFEVGEKVYLGEGLIITSMLSEKTCRLTIGSRVAIAPGVTILLSSDANWSRLTEIIAPVRSAVVLEDDCWIGTGAIIFPGVTIGKGAIVGAGSVVKKNVEANCIVAGNPAKFIKMVK